MQRFKLAVASGEPVNPPIWWIAPGDKIAQSIDDEFLLGEMILAAPVIEKGTIVYHDVMFEHVMITISRKNFS